MNRYEEKLKKFINDKNISAEYLSFKQSCHSVEDAARVANTSIDNLVKNICMIDHEGNLIVAVVKGEDRASTSRVGKILSIEQPRVATEDEILAKAGYPCGGIPSFGFAAIFLLDPKVMEKEVLYSSGGSEYSLIKIATKELQKANNGIIARIRK